MCIIEYVGYSCGHSSVPVLRLCPMTTCAPSNPVCKDPSHRPTMVGHMCPACSRVMHSRWVDIVMFEHQWMHERGTCGCPTKFPSLLHPRTIGIDPGGEARRYTGHTTLRGISDQMGEAMSRAFDNTGSGTSATTDEDKNTVHSPTMSPSPTANVSIHSMAASTAHQHGARSTTAAVDLPFVSSSHIGKGDHKGKGKGKGKKKSHNSVKQKGKGKGKGKGQHQKQQRDNDGLDTYTMTATPPHDTISATHLTESFQLPSMESSSADGFHTAGAGSPLQQVNVRLASQFAAEWIPDHAERHRTGACSCHVRFERYQPYEVTEAEYYSQHGPQQGSNGYYYHLDKVTADMEVLGLGHPDGGGSSSFGGAGSTDIMPPPHTTQDVEGEGRGKQTDEFFPFASSSPEMTMSGDDAISYGTSTMSVSPDYATVSAAVHDTNTFATAPQSGPVIDTSLLDMGLHKSSYRTAETVPDDVNTYSYNNYKPTAPAPSGLPISTTTTTTTTTTPRALLYSYPAEQSLRPTDIAHWRLIESSPDPPRSWAAAATRPEDFGFRSVDEAARVLALSLSQAQENTTVTTTGNNYPPEQQNAAAAVAAAAAIRSRPAPVVAADHLANTLYYQHFDPDDPATYPLVAWPLGAGPEGGPEYGHSPRWDVCHLARPRLRRSRSLGDSSS